MDRLFEDFFGSTSTANGSPRPLPTYALPLDVREVEGGYEMEAPVPGFEPEEVEVTFSEGILRIEAQHSEQSGQNRPGYLRREVAHANYVRAIQLPPDVNGDDIRATFENGMLKLSVPKVPRPQPRKIQISGRSKELSGKASR